MFFPPLPYHIGVRTSRTFCSFSSTNDNFVFYFLKNYYSTILKKLGDAANLVLSEKFKFSSEVIQIITNVEILMCRLDFEASEKESFFIQV